MLYEQWILLNYHDPIILLYDFVKPRRVYDLPGDATRCTLLSFQLYVLALYIHGLA